jgi:hypothetical protein
MHERHAKHRYPCQNLSKRVRTHQKHIFHTIFWSPPKSLGLLLTVRKCKKPGVPHVARRCSKSIVFYNGKCVRSDCCHFTFKLKRILVFRHSVEEGYPGEKARVRFSIIFYKVCGYLGSHLYAFCVVSAYLGRHCILCGIRIPGEPSVCIFMLYPQTPRECWADPQHPRRHSQHLRTSPPGCDQHLRQPPQHFRTPPQGCAQHSRRHPQHLRTPPRGCNNGCWSHPPSKVPCIKFHVISLMYEVSCLGSHV